MTLADLMYESARLARLRRMGWKIGNVEPERSCRLCGSGFIPEEDGQLFCSEECEDKDRKIDEAEIRREEREDI